MPAVPRAIAAWTRFRYERLFLLARRGRTAARWCGRVAGRVEYLVDPVRRDVATRRIARALGVSDRQARALFRAALVSEASEEAVIVFLLAHPDALARTFSPRADEPAHEPGTVYVTFHLGHPVLAYLYLARVRGLRISAIARALDEDNPMEDAKRRHGRSVIEWLGRVARPLLHGDPASLARARDLLLAGESIFAPIDLPGDVVARAATIDVFGEPVRFASGMITLARLSKARIRPFVAVGGRDGIALHWGALVSPGNDAETAVAVFGELLALVRRFPGEWWMWPYLVAADRAARS